jgi:protein TonB
MLAIGVHGLLILGIQFSEPAAPPKSPAWSLHVSFLKPAGGQQDTTTHTAPPKPSGLKQPALPAVPETVPETAPTKPLDDTAKLITTPTPATTLPSEQPPSATPAEVYAKPTPPSSEPALTTLNVADLMDQGLRQARLSADQDRLGNAREKHADLYNTTTPDGAYAAYWVGKVERMGELNLPRTLRQSKGKAPILDVAIRADGSLGDILIIRSSGNKQLDATIRRIVTEAAPYAPFPDTLRRQYDVLRIKHQWTFR